MAESGHTPESTTKVYDPKIDIAKGLLIILVVLGHCLERCGSAPSKDIIHNIIYLFHMPAFIAISGYLTHPKDNHKFWKSQLKLIETYFFFQALHFLPYMWSGKHTILNYFVLPEWTMWYLLCLTVWRTLIQYFHKVINAKPLVIFILSIVLSLLIGFIPVSRFLSIQRMVAFMPFFIGGYIYRDCLSKLWHKKYLKAALYGISIVLVLFFLITSEGMNDMFACSKPYFRTDGLQYGMILRLAIFICATALTSIVMFLADKMANNKWLIQLGKNTLLIYMLHSFIILAASHFFKNSTISAFAISAVIIAGLNYMGKFDTSIILNPISTICKKIMR